MYDIVGTNNSILIANVLVLIIICLLVVIVGCALLLILQFILGVCGFVFKFVCKPTILVYNKFRNESLLNEREELFCDNVGRV